MAEKITIDDSAKITVPNAPTVVYSPPNSWKENVICGGCNVTAGPAMSRLWSTAASGTWTNAWWEGAQKVLTATLEFQGNEIATDFILFYRSGDVNGSVGDSTLRFSIDSVEKLNLQMVASDYTFQNDFVRQRLFSDSTLDPNANHTLRIQWTHSGVRPVVAVALDSIEYTGTLPKPSDGQGTTETGGSTNSESRGSNSSNIAKIVAPTVVAVVAVLILLGFLLRLFWVRRQKRRGQPKLVDPDTPDPSLMQLHPQSNWNATLYNRPGSLYHDQSFDGHSSGSGVLLRPGAGAGGPGEPAWLPPPYADTDTSTSLSQPPAAPTYPTPVTKSRS